ncbi:hypothetical protein HELRODRAFT_193089 [Helobdella robusta]|uniref:Aminoacyl-transfer RNA synthetases class-II family profile domain-containing protein n=1 Tax=Helobdella robusta TaxID=6412 RepID=T1FUM0_HELRO|nr:hypothetical protein HELRODRAFT_193089 [Helobdella robusta]ESN98102.1 hypothetical protein HELRODRAFT_193089 [Helobdella robusta]
MASRNFLLKSRLLVTSSTNQKFNNLKNLSSIKLNDSILNLKSCPLASYRTRSDFPDHARSESSNKKEINSGPAIKNIRKTCRITKENLSERVKISGWVQYKRMLGQFMVLRDSYGFIQVMVNDPLILISLKDLPLESVLEVTGVVRYRPEEQSNEDMPSGELEVLAENVQILNRCNARLPFQIQEFHEVKEPLRLQYRYLDLRHRKLQQNLRQRSKILFKMREYLMANEFVDVETPILFRKTPGGAREFIVPTHDKGKAYCLPQSPQQFKQLLMVGGIDRYMQIAKCFRDETAKPDRQPEFTQVDIEMSFVDVEDVKNIVEGMLVHSWPGHLKPIHSPFPKMDFHDAIRVYGSDKPDTRFDNTLQEVTDIFEHCNFTPLMKSFRNRPMESIQVVQFPHVSPYLSNKDVSYLTKVLKSSFHEKHRAFFAIVRIKEDNSWHGTLHKMIGDLTYKRLEERLQLNPGDVFIIAAGLDRNACLTAGKFRVEMASLLKEKGISVYEDDDSMNFLWIENFPLFLPKEDGSGGLESAHHPFTAPHPDDLTCIYSNPEAARGLHYDLVLNGAEVGGGSIRIHNADLQKYVLQDILKEDAAPLQHLIDALNSGCPPHGGIALGVDRYLSIICNTQSIRDVIAFPKSSEGKCLMSQAPSTISKDDMEYYHLTVKE